MDRDAMGLYLTLDDSIDGQPRCYVIQDMQAEADQLEAANKSINLYNGELEFFLDNLPTRQAMRLEHAVKVCQFTNGGI